MARTLLDLFKNDSLATQEGRPAEDVYEIRDSKNIPWSSANPLIQNTGIQVANEARSRLGNRTSETLVEQETTGLRVLRTASIPVLYGTELGRLTLGSTRTKDRMLEDSLGAQSDFGLLGESVERAKDGIDSLKSKLGFPNKAIPTYVVQQLEGPDYDLTLTQNRSEQLQKIKNGAEGGVLGNLLDGNGGSIQGVGRQLVGDSLRAGKDFVKSSLLGSNQGTSNGIKVEGEIVYPDPYISFNTVTGFTSPSQQWRGVYGYNYGSDNEQVDLETSPQTDVTGLRITQLNKEGSTYENLNNINPISPDEKNDLSDKQVIAGFPEKLSEIRYSTVADGVIRPKKDIWKFARNINLPDIRNEDTLAARGINTTSDNLNYQGILDDENFEDVDFITLKFKSIPTGKVSYFRSTISGLSETFSPEWESNKFVGNPFSYYTYSGIERSVSFNFTVFSLSAREHKRSWQRLNFLSSLTYPQGYYENSTAIKPPLIEFTLGDMYKRKASFIQSLSFSVDDTYPWNISNDEDESYVSDVLSSGERVIDDEDLTNYKLPMLIDVDIEIQILESRGNTESKKFYSFNPQNV